MLLDSNKERRSPSVKRATFSCVSNKYTSPLYVPTRTSVSFPEYPLSRIKQCTASTDSPFNLETTSLQCCESVMRTFCGSFDSVICKIEKRTMLLILESSFYHLNRKREERKCQSTFHTSIQSAWTQFHKYYEQCYFLRYGTPPHF